MLLGADVQNEGRRIFYMVHIKTGREFCKSARPNKTESVIVWVKCLLKKLKNSIGTILLLPRFQRLWEFRFQLFTGIMKRWNFRLSEWGRRYIFRKKRFSDFWDSEKLRIIEINIVFPAAFRGCRGAKSVMRRGRGADTRKRWKGIYLFALRALEHAKIRGTLEPNYIWKGDRK